VTAFLRFLAALSLATSEVFSNCAIAPKTCRTKIAVAAPKRLELLNKLIPTATAVAVLLNPSNPNGELTWRRLKPAAGALGMG
jgi:histidinol-phosphate/aromatic aminotransferase/cobyric acid decarboxylase-like protein